MPLTGTLTFKVNILNPKHAHMFITKRYNDNSDSSVNILIPPSNEWQESSLSTTLDETVKHLWLHISFYGDVNDICYTDDWRLTLQ